MGDANKREERAFDALIVSQLRRKRDILSLEDLPPLSDEDLMAMNSIPDNIIETMWTEECSGAGPSCAEEEKDLALAGTGDGINFGMNRAIQMEEDDQNTLDASREEAREELRRQILKAKEKHNG